MKNKFLLFVLAGVLFSVSLRAQNMSLQVANDGQMYTNTVGYLLVGVENRSSDKGLKAGLVGVNVGLNWDHMELMPLEEQDKLLPGWTFKYFVQDNEEQLTAFEIWNTGDSIEPTGLRDFAIKVRPKNLVRPRSPINYSFSWDPNLGGMPNDNDLIDDAETVYFSIINPTLPVNFVSFEAAATHSGVNLLWKTANEHSNKGFYVERSVDGTNYREVSNLISPKKGEELQQGYSHTDNGAVFGKVNYYRIKQVDVDGKLNYSEVKSVSVGGAQELSVYPNPATTQITVKAQGLVQVYDISGKLVLSQQSVNGTAVVNISRLAKGTYIVKSGSNTAKFIKL